MNRVYNLYFLLIYLFLNLSSARSKSVPGLYSDEDDLIILNGDNFKDHVFESPYLWLVEFYSAWCGHCQNFAPTFKSLAKNVREWQNVVKLSVVNCPDDINKDLCRDMNVDGYPELRYVGNLFVVVVSTPAMDFKIVIYTDWHLFVRLAVIDCSGMTLTGQDTMVCRRAPFWFHNYPHERFISPYANTSDKGISLQGRLLETMRSEIVVEIEKNLDKYKFESNKPDFKPVSFESFTKFAYSPIDQYYRAFVFEAENSTMGKEIILDSSPCSNITIHRVIPSLQDGEKIANKLSVSINHLPEVVVVTANGSVSLIDVKIKSRSFYTYKLQRLPGILKQEFENTETVKEMKEEAGRVLWSDIDQSKVYLSDIESSIHYSFTNEISSHAVIDGDRIQALNKYLLALSLLANHLPVMKSTSNFLKRMHEWVETKPSFKYNEFENEIAIRKPDNYLPDANRQWVGCASSEPSKRGYPCSLWTWFHVLTVAAHNAHIRDVTIVPQAIASYVTTYFTCKVCSENFKKELIKFPFPSDKESTTKETVLWLWTVHNSVNKRLHGDISEDSHFIKTQYPPADRCHDCKNAQGEWDTEAVFKFLINRYSKTSISDEYLHAAPPSKKMPMVPDHLNAVMVEDNVDFGNDYKAYEDMLKAAQNIQNDADLLNEHKQNREKVPQIDTKDLINNFHPKDLNFQNNHSFFSKGDQKFVAVVWLLSICGCVMLYYFIRIKWKYRPKKFRLH